MPLSVGRFLNRWWTDLVHNKANYPMAVRVSQVAHNAFGIDPDEAKKLQVEADRVFIRTKSVIDLNQVISAAPSRSKWIYGNVLHYPFVGFAALKQWSCGLIDILGRNSVEAHINHEIPSSFGGIACKIIPGIVFGIPELITFLTTTQLGACLECESCNIHPTMQAVEPTDHAVHEHKLGTSARVMKKYQTHQEPETTLDLVVTDLTDSAPSTPNPPPLANQERQRFQAAVVSGAPVAASATPQVRLTK